MRLSNDSINRAATFQGTAKARFGVKSGNSKFFMIVALVLTVGSHFLMVRSRLGQPDQLTITNPQNLPISHMNRLDTKKSNIKGRNHRHIGLVSLLL